MNIKSLFTKRNYIHLYHKYKFYPKTVSTPANQFSHFSSFQHILDYIEIEQFDKIVAVASGPSSNHIDWNENTLYFCCNNALKLVEKSQCKFVYTVNDDFYLYKYLKTFEASENWLTTLFYFYVNDHTRYKRNLIWDYLNTYKREKIEFLITNDSNNINSKSLNDSLIDVFSKWGYEHFGVNSGFNNLVLAAVAANYSNLPLASYGLDMGIGGEKYFDVSTTLGKSIKSDFSKTKVLEFLNIIQENLKFSNYSYFK